MSELPTPAELKRVAELLRTLLHLANRPDGTLSEIQSFAAKLEALAAAPPPSANADRLRDALRDLTDAISKDGHARLSYWPQMQTAWAALDSKQKGD